jgi:hypothetical protein
MVFLCVALEGEGRKGSGTLSYTRLSSNLKLRNLPASASRVLGLKACATTPGWITIFRIKSTKIYHHNKKAH